MAASHLSEGGEELSFPQVRLLIVHIVQNIRTSCFYYADHRRKTHRALQKSFSLVVSCEFAQQPVGQSRNLLRNGLFFRRSVFETGSPFPSVRQVKQVGLDRP